MLTVAVLTAFGTELRKEAKVVVSGGGRLPLLPGDLAQYREREALSGGAAGDGSSLGRDKDGYFAYTHRARSESYASPSTIPLAKIKFIGSTS